MISDRAEKHVQYLLRAVSFYLSRTDKDGSMIQSADFFREMSKAIGGNEDITDEIFLAASEVLDGNKVYS